MALDVEVARKALLLTRNSKEYAVKNLDSARVGLMAVHDYLCTKNPSGWKQVDAVLTDCWAKLEACDAELLGIEEGLDFALDYLPLDD